MEILGLAKVCEHLQGCGNRASWNHLRGLSINLLMGTNVDQEQDVRAGFWMFLFRKNNSTIVTSGTRVKPIQPPAQVMRFQTGIIEVFRHAPQGSLDLRLQCGAFSDQATKGAFELRRQNKLAHGSLGFAQAGD